MRFRVGDVDRAEFLANARGAIELLRHSAGFLTASIGQSVDESQLLTIQTEWESVGAYRSAMSKYEVKATVIPFLSHAVDEPTVFEALVIATPTHLLDFESGLASDAQEVSLGEAATNHAPRL
jgi:quinol monooxygenase YgiN